MTKSNSHDDCDCESYIPHGLVKAIIATMALQAFVVTAILAWTTTRWATSPQDAIDAMVRETADIDGSLEEIRTKLDWLVIEAEKGD